jgi:hypothetical protein
MKHSKGRTAAHIYHDLRSLGEVGAYRDPPAITLSVLELRRELREVGTDLQEDCGEGDTYSRVIGDTLRRNNIASGMMLLRHIIEQPKSFSDNWDKAEAGVRKQFRGTRAFGPENGALSQAFNDLFRDIFSRHTVPQPNDPHLKDKWERLNRKLQHN